MPQLSLTKEYQSGTNASVGVSAQEPNGDFWTYRVNAIDTIDNSMAIPDTSNFYPFEKQDTIKAPTITITSVDNIGVKKFIGWGAGAFYHPIDSEYSYLVLPIHSKLNEKEAPIITITNNNNTVIFDIAQNSKVNYETVRLTVQQGNVREEKIIYFKKGQSIHYEMVTTFKNIVTASVRAHANELNVISALTETELNLGGTLESVLTISQNSASRFNHNATIVKFYDGIGVTIENVTIKRTEDDEYTTDTNIIKTILIPDRSTYGDDFIITVSETEYYLITDGVNTYGYITNKWEIVAESVYEPDTDTFMDYGIHSIPDFDNVPQNSHLLVYDEEQEGKEYELTIVSNPLPQIISTKTGIALPFATTAEQPTLSKITDHGGNATVTDYEQAGNKVDVEITLSKPTLNASVNVYEIKVPFHRGN